MSDRIYLSPPHLAGEEEAAVVDALRSNWIAPLGPHVDALESEVAAAMGAEAAVALSSGTAAIHLALRVLGVGRDDPVVVSSLTFAGSVFPIAYQGARPVFVDSEARSWNMAPERLGEALAALAAAGTPARAVIVVHLYGQAADMDRITALCDRFDVPLIEDAAEALGTTYRDRPVGSFGRMAAVSFNGNKIITASAGGMLLSEDRALVERARKLATQAREEAIHYEHREVGYNYRMSNVLAALGRAQLTTLEERVATLRRNFAYYRDALGGLDGVELMPDAGWGRHTRWLTTLTIDPDRFGATREDVRLALEAENIEARPVWKPMHAQPVFYGASRFGGEVADALFRDGLCLPSGSDLTETDLERIAGVVRGVHHG